MLITTCRIINTNFRVLPGHLYSLYKAYHFPDPILFNIVLASMNPEYE